MCFPQNCSSLHPCAFHLWAQHHSCNLVWYWNSHSISRWSLATLHRWSWFELNVQHQCVISFSTDCLSLQWILLVGVTLSQPCPALSHWWMNVVLRLIENQGLLLDSLTLASISSRGRLLKCDRVFPRGLWLIKVEFLLTKVCWFADFWSRIWNHFLDPICRCCYCQFTRSVAADLPMPDLYSLYWVSLTDPTLTCHFASK